jgi:hypothetical protein
MEDERGCGRRFKSLVRETKREDEGVVGCVFWGFFQVFFVFLFRVEMK